MRKAKVYRNGELVGILIEENKNSYIFTYDDKWYNDINKPGISLTLPKDKLEYRNNFLFPFFYNMLSEGVNKKNQCIEFHIDENDSFGLLLASAQNDTIGPVTVKPVE